MKRFEVSNAFINTIDPEVNSLGFIRKQTDDGWRYHKNTNFGHNEISLLIWQYGDIFYVDIVFSIRISDLNKVYNPFTTASPSYYDSNNTINAGFTFDLSEEGKIKVETLSELERAMRELKRILLDKGIPFFEQFTTIESLDKELNRENREPHLYVHDSDRCVLGLTAAALNQNPNFSYWEQYYRDKLRNASQSRKEKYEALVFHLKSLN
jgi:hypothetical protein